MNNQVKISVEGIMQGYKDPKTLQEAHPQVPSHRPLTEDQKRSRQISLSASMNRAADILAGQLGIRETLLTPQEAANYVENVGVAIFEREQAKLRQLEANDEASRRVDIARRETREKNVEDGRNLLPAEDYQHQEV